MTEQQAKLLRFIKQYQAAHLGVSPCFDEMRQGIGLKSKSGVDRLLDALERQGLVRRLRYRARGIVVQEPDLCGLSDGALLAEAARRGLLVVA